MGFKIHDGDPASAVILHVPHASRELPADALLKATEVQELEKARQQIAEQRKRYASNK